MDHEIVFLASAVATIIGTVVAVSVAGVAYWKFLSERNADRKNASKNLHTELRDTLVALNDRSPENWTHVEIREDAAQSRRLYFINRMLNHDFYDSMIFSGKINFLEPKTQQPIQDIFRQIKIHNKYLTRIGHLMEKKGDGTIPDDAYKYCEWMHENEPNLERSIQNMLEELKRYF